VLLRIPVIALATCILAYGQQQRIVFDQPLLIVNDGKYGFIDHSGNVMIKPQFYWSSDFSDGFATVYVCGNLASINPSGKIQAHRLEMNSGLALRRNGSGTGYVDSSGRFQIPPKYEDGLPFSEGLAAVKMGDKWGFVDADGRLVIAPRFAAAYYFVEGVAIADLGESHVLINRTGNVVADGFDHLWSIGDGRVLVSQRQKWGFIDFGGNVRVPLIYDGARDGFQGGLTSMVKDGKWGYLDRNGGVVIPFQFGDAGPFFANSLPPAKIGKKTGFIDRSGNFKFLLPYRSSPGFVYGDVAPFWTEDGRFGYVNASGKIIWGPAAESPDHAPILGWTEKDKLKSCDGISVTVRTLVANLATVED